MRITRNQIKRIIKEVKGDSSELLNVIQFKVITNTGPGTDYDMEDILIDIRGLNGVITVSQNEETSSLGFTTGMERRLLNVKFDNSPYVDIPTLKVDVELVPGVQEAEILTVDGAPFSREQAQADYDMARSPESREWWNKRNEETKIPELEKPKVRESKIKITKKQLRKIIKEAMAPAGGLIKYRSEAEVMEGIADYYQVEYGSEADEFIQANPTIMNFLYNDEFGVEGMAEQDVGNLVYDPVEITVSSQGSTPEPIPGDLAELAKFFYNDQRNLPSFLHLITGTVLYNTAFEPDGYELYN